MIAERRIKPRIQQPFPAIVEGTDSDGQAFHFSTELENISSTGFYLRVPREVDVGDDLKFLISLSNGLKPGATVSGVGRVLRVEPGLNHLNGFALEIVQYEFA